MKISFTSLCDKGLARERNEDCCAFCSDLTSSRQWQTVGHTDYLTIGSLGCVGIVADGMGGLHAGDVASALALKSLQEGFLSADYTTIEKNPEQSIPEFLREQIANANAAIEEYALSHFEVSGLGTTIVVVWIYSDRAYIVWCGDSRCYQFTPTRGLLQLTTDHSYVQSLIDQHQLTVDQAFGHPENNVVSRCLGDADVSHLPEVISVPLKPNTTLLLSTDGLHGYIRDREIASHLLTHFSNPQSCADQLLQSSLSMGGLDNITIMILSLISDNATSPCISFFSKLANLFR